MNIFFMGRDEKEINWSTLQWKKKIVRNSEQILLEAGKRVQSIKF